MHKPEMGFEGVRLPPGHHETATRTGRLQGRAVLIVEDEDFIAEDLASAVRAHGGRVVGPAASPDAAMELIRRYTVSLAIVDINLGGTPAYPVIDLLASLNVPVTLATGLTSEMIAPQYRHFPTWVKPYLPDTLVRAVSGL